MEIDLVLNGTRVSVDSSPYASLLSVLRERLQTRSVKQGCDFGGCGACTVLIDKEAFYSCMTPVIRVRGKSVTSVEGLTRDGIIDPLQSAFQQIWAVQCGFCSAGVILSARALLNSHRSPAENNIREAIVGNLCVCTGYQKIVEAIQLAAKHQKE